jgi:signal transduction histidine kinase
MASRAPGNLAIWILALVSIGASLAFLAYRVVGSSDGAVVAFYADAWRAGGVEVSPIDQPPGGLAPGDVVTAIAGRPLADWIDHAADPGVDRAALAGPAAVPYSVSRGGAAVTVPVTLAPRDVRPILLDNWSAILFTVVLQAVAAYVLWRRPQASAARALMVASCGVTGSTLPWLLGLQLSDLALGWPFLLYAATAGGIYMLLWPAGTIHLPLAFAAGPPGPSRRVLTLAYGIPLGAYLALLLVGRAASPSATAWMGTWAAAQGVVIVPSIVAFVGLIVRGFRSALPSARRQFRWALWGGALATIPSLGLLFLPQLLLGRPLIPWTSVGLLALPMPIGIALGILRDQLFDIDVVVNRTLVYGGATLGLLAVYAASVSLLGALLPIEGGFPASLLATGIAAIAALPIRDALQRTVNRVMYGDRDDPYRALARLGTRLEAALDPLEVPTVIIRTIAESMRLPWAALRLGPAGGGRTIEHGQRPAGEVVAVPLVYGAEEVGDLVVAPRSPSEPLSGADRALLEALARQAGAAVHAVSLTLDLVASRERLVAAREEERRRIRRDLHDGLGPTLAAIGMRAEVATDLVSHDPAAAERVLGELRGEVAAALADIRRLVDALRPPALDELGLVGALRSQADRLSGETVIDVEAGDRLPELPAAVEVAAYRIAVEAMTNAARHAGARTCRVRLACEEGSARSLALDIVDDGRGLPARVRPGIGLQSMRERAAEVGGTCRIDRPAGGGTRVAARLPIGAAGSAG